MKDKSNNVRNKNLSLFVFMMPPHIKTSFLKQNYTILITLKHVCQFEKQRVALISLLPETACSLLVNQLYKTKKRMEAVDKNNLDLEVFSSV
jgi:hypothetical protein